MNVNTSGWLTLKVLHYT